MIGVYREVVSDERLAYTHAWDRSDGSRTTETLITITLADRHGRTELTFRQAGFASAADRDSHREGWSESLDRLEAYIAARSASTNRELSITRLINAPPELCFKAWTEHLPEWWGPHGMTTPVWEMDLRAGGLLRTVMRMVDGAEFSHQGVFLEVTAPSRIVFTDAYAPGWKPASRPFMTAMTTFEPENGKIRCTARALHWTEEARQEHEAMGFYEGWGQSADRFEAVVARWARASAESAS